MEHVESRRDLAAVLRWTARQNMHEGIANHYSLAVSDDGSKFLMNPYGVHWSQMRASDYLELDANCDTYDIGENIDPTAFSIHGALHRHIPRACCIMHVHSIYATALSCLKDPTLPPVDQNAMRFYNRVAIDTGFDGMGLGDEATRLAGALGNKSILMMGQHGVLVLAETVAQAFDDIYHFERSAQIYMTAKASGEELNIASPEVAEKTAQQWADYPNFAEKHLSAIRSILDKQEPEYKD